MSESSLLGLFSQTRKKKSRFMRKTHDILSFTHKGEKADKAQIIHDADSKRGEIVAKLEAHGVHVINTKRKIRKSLFENTLYVNTTIYYDAPEGLDIADVVDDLGGVSWDKIEQFMSNALSQIFDDEKREL